MNNIIIIMFMLVAFTPVVFGFGLSVTWSEVRIDNLKIGVTYNLKEAARLPFQVTYRGDKEAEVIVDVLSPKKDELKEIYEPIPNVSWIQLTNSRFILGPGENGYSDVIITIPNDKKYFRKKYQVQLYTHAVPGYGSGGATLGVAVGSRLLISIAQSEETLQELELRKRGKLIANLSFKVMPDKILVTDIPVGKKVDLKKEKSILLKILNPSEEVLDLILENLPQGKSLVSGERGYEYTPNHNFLKLDKTKMKIKPNTIAEVKLYLDFPSEDAYRDKKYFFVIKIEPVEQTIPVSYYVKLYVETAKGNK